MEYIFSDENRKNFKKLFLNINKNVTIVFIFFIVYRVNAFRFYMDLSDFASYISFSFIVSQVFSFFISLIIFSSSILICYATGRNGLLYLVYNLVSYGGGAVSLFSFIFSMERVFIDQYFLNAIHLTEIRRVIFELFYGLSIFSIAIYLGIRACKTQVVSKQDPADQGGESPKTDHLNRRLFITSSASALAAATVGSRIIMGNNFDFPVDYSSFDKSENRKNVILVTFDALSAADMSVYGYGLNTTPHIDLFAKSSDVHENFYACSTFTTPSLSTIMTGRYPSHSGIHQLGGMLHGEDIYRTLPALLKAAGYKTAVICGNPYAMPLMGSTHGAFDHLYAAPRMGWTDLPPSELMELSGMMDMVDLVERTVTVSGLVFPPLRMGLSQTPPRATFEAAKNLISKMEGPFFIWIHVMAPHAPYLPSEEFRHRFLRPGLLETRQDMLRPRILDRTKSKSQIQTDVEHLRLRYGEWVSEADSAFGEFMGFMDKSDLMKDTMTMVSADHGEFFAPNSFGHGGDAFYQPLIHVPMIVKMPGQEAGQRIAVVADQTAIAPTILDVAGLSIPQWMSGDRLSRGAPGSAGGAATSGTAVTQYLEENSSFKPITTGTIGAVRDGFQYVRTLSNDEEKLYVMEDVATFGGALVGERRDVKGDMKHTLESIRDDIKSIFPEVKI